LAAELADFLYPTIGLRAMVVAPDNCHSEMPGQMWKKFPGQTGHLGGTRIGVM
jgi:hypothetical protein